MTIKIFKICLFDGTRIHELYELNEKAAARLREMKTERDFHRVQLKGYGNHFKELLEQIEEHKQQEREQARKLELLKSMFIESEKARKSLGEKLRQAERELERLREEKGTSSTASGSPAELGTSHASRASGSPCAGKESAGESETEGGDEA